MSIPPVDLAHLRDQVRELADQMHERWETSTLAESSTTAPRVLRDAFAQLTDVLTHLEPDAAGATTSTELNTLAAYGLHLLTELGELATALELPRVAASLELQSLPFGLWVARRGAELRSLDAMVNAIAHYANQASHPQAMADLYTCCCEIIEAASPTCAEIAPGDAQAPWRLLLLNRAIVATRSHNPELMSAAFDAIIEHLPADARQFFAEGMEQMVIIDYPDQVKEMMRQYYLAHAAPRHLH